MGFGVTRGEMIDWGTPHLDKTGKTGGERFPVWPEFLPGRERFTPPRTTAVRAAWGIGALCRKLQNECPAEKDVVSERVTQLARKRDSNPATQRKGDTLIWSDEKSQHNQNNSNRERCH